MTHATAADTADASGPVALHARAFAALEDATATWLIPTLARLVFAGVLLVYFWRSALTKLGDGVFGFLSPSTGAYVQIFPKKAEAVRLRRQQFSASRISSSSPAPGPNSSCPLLIVLGLLTRLAALGMIGFVIVRASPTSTATWPTRRPSAPGSTASQDR